MIPTLSAMLILVAAVLAVWTAISAALDRPVAAPHLAGLLAVEVLTVLQLVVGVAALLSGDRPDSTATFVSYLVTVPLLVPAGVAWSRTERSRSGTLVITVVCVAIPVMTARLLQLWATHG